MVGILVWEVAGRWAGLQSGEGYFLLATPYLPSLHALQPHPDYCTTPCLPALVAWAPHGPPLHDGRASGSFHALSAALMRAAGSQQLPQVALMQKSACLLHSPMPLQHATALEYIATDNHIQLGVIQNNYVMKIWLQEVTSDLQKILGRNQNIKIVRKS